MPVVVAEFLAPRGPIDAALLFPMEGQPAIDARFNAYIAAGTAEAAKLTTATADQRERITRLYVVWRAYDAVTDRMSATPSTFTAADEGSVSFSSAQLKTFAAKRDSALDAYNGAVSELGADVVVSAQRPSVTIPTIFRF